MCFPIVRPSFLSRQVIILAATLAGPAAVQAGVKPITEVTASGAAPIENNQVTQAKERAIHDAMRRAVETGVGVLVAGESESRNMKLLADSVYTKAEGFVEGYEVLEQSRKDEMYHVTIRARVQKATLAARLVDVLVLDQQMDMPQIMVLVADKKGGFNDPQRSARTVLVQKFTEKRFRLINPQIAEKLQEDRSLLANLQEDRNLAARLANEHAADLVVVCTADAEDKGSARGLAQSQAILRLLTVNPSTAQEFVGDEAELTGAGDTSPEAARAAARRVAEEAGDYAINQLILWWIRQSGPGGGKEFVVELQNPGSLLRVGRPFINLMKEVQGVKQVKTVSQSNELIRLMVSFEGGGKDLLVDGIASKSERIPALASLELVLDRGNQIVFSLGGDASPRAGAGDLPAKPLTVAVIPFNNKTTWAQLDSTAEACARRTESICLKAKDFRVVDRSRLDVVLKEADLAAAGIVEADAVKLGPLLPAEAIVLGEISGQKQTLRVFLRIVRTDNGEVLKSAEAEVQFDDRDRLPDKLTSALETALGSKEVGDYRGKLGLPRP